ncbi:MAG: MFS transporter [Flavobacteriaceae bacterium]|nr:MFS transporter [Flavobacteriaceae bacterium]
MTLKQETRIIILLAFINFVNIVDFMVLMPLAPQIKEAFQLGASQWGGVVSAYTISAFVAGILALFMIDRYNRKTYLMLNMIGFVGGTFLCGISDSYEFLMFSRIFTGFFGGVISSVSIAIVTDVTPMERRGRSMGIFMGGFAAAAALGVPFGTVLGAKHTLGWNFPFMALATLGGIMMVVCYYVLPRISPAKKDENNTHVTTTVIALKSITKDSNQRWGFLLMCLIVFVQFMIVPFYSPFLVSNLGLNELQLAGTYAIGGISSIAFNPLIGKMSDRIGHVKMYTILALLACIPIWLCTSLEDISYPIVLLLSACFFAFAGGRFTPAVALMISTAKPHQRGIFNTLRNSVQNGVAGIAALFAGIIVTQVTPTSKYEHYATAGIIAIGVNLLSILVIRKVKAVS